MLDYQANGTVDVFDLLEFRRRYRETLPFVFGSSRSFSSGLDSKKGSSRVELKSDSLKVDSMRKP